MTNSHILIYQTEDGKTKIETRLENETAWLTIDQMSELFQKSRSTINEHIINIYDENELQKEIDDYLDSSQNGAYLNGVVLKYLYDFLKSKDGKLYKLDAFAIMSNHVHLLIKPIEDLSKIMQMLKGASAKAINEILGKSDKFWADDYYDKAIRDEKHFWVVYEYIRNNPLKIDLAETQLPNGTDTLSSEVGLQSRQNKTDTGGVKTPLPRFYGVCK